MTPEMIAYVKAELSSGKSPAEVRQALLGAGWPPADVEQALSLSLGPAPVSAAYPPPPPPGAAAGGWGFGSRGFGYRSRTVKQMTPGQSLAFGLLFAVVGAAMAYFGFRSYASARSLAENGLRADGTVIRLEEKVKHDEDGTSRTYRPIVEYSLPDGAKKQYASDLWRNPSPFREGQAVKMIYDPATGRAAIDTGGELFGTSYILLGMGAVFFLVGAAVAAASRRRQTAIGAPERSSAPPPV